MKNSLTKKSTLNCNLGALDSTQREHHQANRETNYLGPLKRLRNCLMVMRSDCRQNQATIVKAAEFITLERLCCPFFNFALELERRKGVHSG